MSASRDALIAVLRAHQGVADVTGYADPVAVPIAECTCGAADTHATNAEQWQAEHQADATIAAGISPFRIDHVETS